MQKLIAHADAPIPSLREKRVDVPPAIDAVFQRMIAKRPGDRYQTATELIAALRTALDPSAAAVGPIAAAPRSDDDLTAFFSNTGGSAAESAVVQGASVAQAAAGDTRADSGSDTGEQIPPQQAARRIAVGGCDSRLVGLAFAAG